MPGRKSRGFGKALAVTLSLLLFLAGLAVYLYPTANGILTDQILRYDAEQFLSFVLTENTEKSPQPSVAVPEQSEPVLNPPRKYPQLWDQMRAYNEAIYASGQAELSDESSYERPTFILEDYLTDIEQWKCTVSAVPQMGFNGIAAAFLGGLSPIGTIFASFFIQHITEGGTQVDMTMYCSQISDLISAIIIYLCGFTAFLKLAMNKGIAKFESKNAKERSKK